MSLNWSWKEKAGELLFKDCSGKEEVFSLYTGNAMLIMLHEFEDAEGEECYDLFSFWCDKDHAKNCLGLSKGTDNIYLPGEFKKIVFYRANISNKDIAVISDLLSKAFPNIEISSIYYK